MATLAITIPNGASPKAVVNRWSNQLEELAASLHNNVTGGATVITIDNAPGNGTLTFQVTSGPHAGGESGKVRRA